jgi:hypothetical protein
MMDPTVAAQHQQQHASAATFQQAANFVANFVQAAQQNAATPAGAQAFAAVRQAAAATAAAAMASQQSQQQVHQSIPLLPAARAVSHATAVPAHAAVKLFETWHSSHPVHQMSFRPLHELPLEVLDSVIGDWILQSRKANGGD